MRCNCALYIFFISTSSLRKETLKHIKNMIGFFLSYFGLLNSQFVRSLKSKISLQYFIAVLHILKVKYSENH